MAGIGVKQVSSARGTSGVAERSQGEQRRVIYSGHVQGVGFRYTTRNLASGFDVTGYVKNLPDGQVELLVEGTSAELDRFLAELRQQMGGYIRDQTCDTRPGTGQFTAFEIRH